MGTTEKIDAIKALTGLLDVLYNAPVTENMGMIYNLIEQSQTKLAELIPDL